MEFLSKINPINLIYLLGFMTFIGSLLNDWLNSNRKLRSIVFYVKEFIFTSIMIIAGIMIIDYYVGNGNQKEVTELPKHLIPLKYITSITMGLIGSALLNKVQSMKTKIVNAIMNKVGTRLKLKSNKNKNPENPENHG